MSKFFIYLKNYYPNSKIDRQFKKNMKKKTERKYCKNWIAHKIPIIIIII